MFDFSPRLRGFLAAVALQRQPYLSVDNLRPAGAELRRVGRFRPRSCGEFLAAVALQRQPYLSVDNLRPTSGEILGWAGALTRGVISF